MIFRKILLQHQKEYAALDYLKEMSIDIVKEAKCGKNDFEIMFLLIIIVWDDRRPIL